VLKKTQGNTGNTSSADTGGFREILVIPVLQILEDSGFCFFLQIL
jgi:hypothetical protein